MRSKSELFRALLAPLLLAPPLAAQAPPSPAEALGRETGGSFTDAVEAVRYARLLASATDRAVYRPYGSTPEGRELGILALSSPGTLARLDAVLAEHARLADPNLSPSDASRIAASTPAVVWLMYGVHGDESSSTEAALWTAWDLVSGGPEASWVLDSLVVVVEPVANPDGRDRYVQWFRTVRGDLPNPEPASAEHAPPWPGGRGNHFLFDLNRDWTWATQPETVARIAEWSRWHPQVHVDFHEMGHTSSYFFFPASTPINPIYPDYTLRWAEHFGRELAAEFDRRQWLYFTAETFDLFYPGYGDSWPSLSGAIGMTFEQAGGARAALAVRRPDGSVLTLGDRIARHRAAGGTTVRAAASRRTGLLLEYAEFHRGLRDGWPDVLLVPGEEDGALVALGAALRRQGIRVERATRRFEATAEPHAGFAPRRVFPPGTLRVAARQPRGRLALTLLQPEVLHVRPEGPGTYDITAWSLPYAYGVEAHTLRGTAAAAFETFPDPAGDDAGTAGPAPADPAGTIGWLVPPSFETAGPLVRWLGAGGRAVALEEPFTLEGRRWPAGTRFLLADSAGRGRLEASGLLPFAVPARTALTESGRDLGTPWSLDLRAPRVGVFRGDGVAPTAFGATWFLLERVAGIPFDALELGSLARLPLDDWDVLVLPDGRPGEAIGEGASDALAGWVERGGTLVASGGAARWAGGALGHVEPRSAEEELPVEERRLRALRTREERRTDSWDDAVNGVILPVRVDGAHPLAWGLGLANEAGLAFVLHIEDLSFEPEESFETVLGFESELRAVSGVVSEAKLAEIAASSWLASVRTGRGRLVLFADDPLFRLMWRSNFVLFTNALLHAPLMR
ncbi:MAG: M14 family zinc carboxypeptidase [Gemmatimonadota bacterium]